MPYSILAPGVSPDDFGSGMQGGLGGLLGRWGDATQRGLYGGMKLGSELTKYGSNQRLAGIREDHERQLRQTGMIQAQNQQLDAQTGQQKLACDRIGWDSKECQAYKAKLEGRAAVGGTGGPMTNAMTSGSAGPLSGGFGSPSSTLGVDPGYDTYDAYDQQGGQSQDWY